MGGTGLGAAMSTGPGRLRAHVAASGRMLCSRYWAVEGDTQVPGWAWAGWLLAPWRWRPHGGVGGCPAVLGGGGGGCAVGKADLSRASLCSLTSCSEML